MYFWCNVTYLQWYLYLTTVELKYILKTKSLVVLYWSCYIPPTPSKRKVWSWWLILKIYHGFRATFKHWKPYATCMRLNKNHFYKVFFLKVLRVIYYLPTSDESDLWYCLYILVDCVFLCLLFSVNQLHTRPSECTGY